MKNFINLDKISAERKWEPRGKRWGSSLWSSENTTGDTKGKVRGDANHIVEIKTENVHYENNCLWIRFIFLISGSRDSLKSVVFLIYNLTVISIHVSVTHTMQGTFIALLYTTAKTSLPYKK